MSDRGQSRGVSRLLDHALAFVSRMRGDQAERRRDGTLFVRSDVVCVRRRPDGLQILIPTDADSAADTKASERLPRIETIQGLPHSRRDIRVARTVALAGNLLCLVQAL